MINDLANSEELRSISQQLRTSEVINSAQTKEVIVALSKIQVGDFLQGQLVVEGDQTMLKLEPGVKLLAHLPPDVALNKKLDFLVVGKEGQHLILELSQALRDKKSVVSITEQALRELGMKDTPELRQIIEQFMGKQLPLIKEQLVQLLHFSRNYEIPTETLTNLVSQDQIPRQEELELLTNLKKQGTEAFRSVFDTLIDTLAPKQSVELASTLLNLLKPHEVNEALQKAYPLQYEEMQQILKQSIVADVGGEEWQYALNKILDEVLQFSSHEQLNKLNKVLIYESLVMQLKSIEGKEKSEIEKLTEMDTRLKQVVKVIKEVVTGNSEEIHLPILENVIQVLDKYRMHGQYFYFPLQLKENQTTGELYFFKPKKQKMMQESGMYVVLALNMPALNKIEVHLVEKSDQISLRIKVENETIKEQMEQYEPILLETMEVANISIAKLAIELLSDKEEKLDITSTMLCHLDFKI